MSSEKHTIRNSVISGLIVALVIWISSFFINVWVWFKDSLLFFFNLFTTTITLPLWLIILLIVGIILSVWRILVFWRKPIKPSWINYTKDEFHEITWRWRFNYIDKSIESLWCFCPHDDTELISCFA